jgi:endonuclease YncB( thermonuclease family)
VTRPALLVRNPDGSYTYGTATVVNVVDGDTCDVDLSTDVGFESTSVQRRRIRILGVDTPEVSTPEGKVARDYARTRWTGVEVVVTVVKFDKYGGRHDGRITAAAPGGVDWATDIIAAGLGKPYNGGPR